MTDPVHLSDEELSDVVDGSPPAAHLDGCEVCGARLAQLRAAAAAVAGALVAPLPPARLDGLVAAALAAEPEVTSPARQVVPLGSRRRRVLVPPPAWLMGAAAALVVLAGLAGLLRSTSERAAFDDAGESVSVADGAGTADAVGSATAGGAAAAVVDPETVVRDLGELDDPAELTSALATATATATTVAAAARVAGDEERYQAEPEAAPTAPAATVVGGGGGGSAPGDRARCLGDAERIGAGRFGALQTTATLRWAGQPAEVLVFTLTEPAGGFTRQALVLARPGCALLADPRF